MDVVQSIAQIGDAWGWPIVTLLIVVVGAGLFAWRVKKKEGPPLDFSDLIVDSGRISASKTANLVALTISSWGMIVLVVRGGLTEWYFMGYMLAWAGNSVMTHWIKSKEDRTSSGRQRYRGYEHEQDHRYGRESGGVGSVGTGPDQP